jgi:hypothetical protein
MFIRKSKNKNCDKIMLFTNARDEKNINEWIAHHFLLGFDKIFIFDHLSAVPISGPRFNGKLTICRVNESKNNIKLDFMGRALNVALKNNADWMLYLDADEYLCINNYNNIKSFLNNFKKADIIGINWLMFGSNDHINHPNGTIVDNFTKSDIRLNQHVKSFVRPECVKRIVNPHFYIIDDISRSYNAFGFRMNNGPFNNTPIIFFKSPIYVAHYHIQSEDEYKHRKGRLMDDGSKPNILSSKEIHSMHNEIVNNQLKCKYGDNIRKFLAIYFP